MTSKDDAMPPAPGRPPAAVDRAAVRAEMEQARLDFHQLLSQATPAGLRRPSDGTRWTNQQLLFHMLLGYLIVRALLVLVRVFGLLPDRASQAFARLLDSARRPFDLINYRAFWTFLPCCHSLSALDRLRLRVRVRDLRG